MRQLDKNKTYSTYRNPHTNNLSIFISVINQLYAHVLETYRGMK